MLAGLKQTLPLLSCQSIARPQSAALPYQHVRSTWQSRLTRTVRRVSMSSQLTEGEKQAIRVQQEAVAWANPVPEPARDGEVPLIDLSEFLVEKEGSLEALGSRLRAVFDSTGFFLIRNHGCEEEIQSTLMAAQDFHTKLTPEEKDSMAFGHRGVGYIRLNQRILPKREKGNMNEAFIVKRELGPRNITLEDNPWPSEARLPGFKQQVLSYADAMEKLALRLVPAVAVALGLPSGYFEPAFQSPLFRLRLSHYPPVDLEPGQFGIAPHTDTTFFTLLAQDGSGGLCVATPDGRWVSVPPVAGAIVVNTGELLRQWSNDRVPSTRHFAVNTSGSDRYSLPFFFNATADYTMECLPTCTSPNNPPRYPPMSFLGSQGVVQGE